MESVRSTSFLITVTETPGLSVPGPEARQMNGLKSVTIIVYIWPESSLEAVTPVLIGFSAFGVYITCAKHLYRPTLLILVSGCNRLTAGTSAQGSGVPG